MSLKNTLTSEKLNQRFDNPFALVNHAIKLARARVLRGEGMDSNPVNDVLEMLAKGEDLYDDVEDDLEEEEEEQADE